MSPKVVKVCKTFLLADITSELFPALEKKFFQLRNDKKQDNTKKQEINLTITNLWNYVFTQLIFFCLWKVLLNIELKPDNVKKIQKMLGFLR